jgi:hypothetical protein
VALSRGFPNGFTHVTEAATRYGAAPGVWLSPWGGYGRPHDERVKYGKEQGFETNEQGFALSGPKYFARFQEIALDFVKRYGVNQFKIDGTGNVNSAISGSAFDIDFHAAISLIREWRETRPDIYVNLTTGTYPRPSGFSMPIRFGGVGRIIAFSESAVTDKNGSPTVTRTLMQALFYRGLFTRSTL